MKVENCKNILMRDSQEYKWKKYHNLFRLLINAIYIIK